MIVGSLICNICCFLRMLLQIQKALFVSVKNTFKLCIPLTYGEHGFAQNWSGWANH